MRIKGDADFTGSSLSSLGKIKVIDGDAIFKSSKIKDIGELTEIKGLNNINLSLDTEVYHMKKCKVNYEK